MCLAFGTRGARDAPAARRQGDRRGGDEGLDLGATNSKGDPSFGAMPRDRVVENCGSAVRQCRARPIPSMKAGFEGLVTFISIEIAGAPPARGGPFKIDLDAGARRDRTPAMAAVIVDPFDVAGQHARPNADLTPDRARNRRPVLVDTEDQDLAVPVDTAAADRQAPRRPAGLITLGHRPGGRASVKGDVERAMAERIGTAVSSGPAVVGGEDAAQKGDQGNPVPPVLAERVDIPPNIAVRRDRAIESRSSISADAARRPDSAAIGIPGPGWVLPPAR